jgi:molybdate transport system substrate-binding protein
MSQAKRLLSDPWLSPLGNRQLTFHERASERSALSRSANMPITYFPCVSGWYNRLDRAINLGVIMRLLASFVLTVCALVAMAGPALSAELKILTSRAVATILEVVGPEFEHASGHKLNVVTGLSSELVKRINDGQPFDIVAVPPPVLDRLIKEGKVTADSRVLLVRSDVGVEIRAGAPKPDISTVEVFKQTLLKAKSITYLPVPGVPQMLSRIGIADDIKSKTIIPNTDVVSELVAKGEVELGIVVITQILTTPGVELVGPLPPEIKVTTTFAGGISASSQSPSAASDLLKFLHSDVALEVIRKQGMEPVL